MGRRANDCLNLMRVPCGRATHNRLPSALICNEEQVANWLAVEQIVFNRLLRAESNQTQTSVHPPARKTNVHRDHRRAKPALALIHDNTLAPAAHDPTS